MSVEKNGGVKMSKEKKMPNKKEKKSVKPTTNVDISQCLTESGDFQERRKTARLDVPIRVEYKIIGRKESPKAAVTKNVSAGGCLFLTTEELPVGLEVELQVFLGETETEALKLKGRIARLNRAEKDLYEFGIVFDALSNETCRLFANYFLAKFMG